MYMLLSMKKLLRKITFTSILTFIITLSIFEEIFWSALPREANVNYVDYYEFPQILMNSRIIYTQSLNETKQ